MRRRRSSYNPAPVTTVMIKMARVSAGPVCGKSAFCGGGVVVGKADVLEKKNEPPSNNSDKNGDDGSKT